MKIHIKNGRVIDPSQKINSIQSLWIQDGKIAIKTNSTPDITIDARGLIVSPGFIDMHCHLREPGQEHKETIRSGTEAAARGGFTSVVCMANTEPVNDNPFITEFIKLKAKTDGWVNVYPVGALSKGLKGEELAEIGGLKEAGCVAISDDGKPVMNSYLMRKALDYCKHFGLPIISHSEDSHLVGRAMINEGLQSTLLGLRGNPAAAEEIMVARDIALAELTKSHVHIAHVSTTAALRLIKDAKKRKVLVTCEVTPHHLFLTEDHIKEYDTHFKVAPPLRSKKDVQALINGLKADTIDVFATDHAPHSSLEKNIEFEEAAFGMIGLETALPITLTLVHNKILSMSKFIEKWSLRPAQILRLPKGSLKIGVDADVTIFDPNGSNTIDKAHFKSKSKNTPFHGWKTKGLVRYTIVGGKIVYKA